MSFHRILLISALSILVSLSIYAQENPSGQSQHTDTEQGGEERKDTERSEGVREVKQSEEIESEEKKAEENKRGDTPIEAVVSPTTTAPQAAPSPQNVQATKKEFFTGSTVSFSNTFGINPDNPLSTLAMKILPKYNPSFTDFFAISGRIDISKEVTNSDSTTYQYETQLSDARLEFVFPELYKEKYTDISLSGFFRTTFPTSKASQYATLRWGNAIDIGISKGFLGEKGMPETQRLQMGYNFRFYKNWHKYTTSEVQESSGGYYKYYPLRVKEPDYLNTGSTNLEYQVAHIFSGSIMVTDKISFIGYFWVINGWAYEPYSGGERGRRDSIDFNIEVDYQVLRWMTVAFGVDTFQPQLLPNSTYTNNPFWRNTYDNYTTLYFDVSFTL